MRSLGRFRAFEELGHCLDVPEMMTTHRYA